MVLLPEDSTGLTAQWHGPFVVLEKPTPLTYVISTPQRGRKTRTFHRNLLKRFIPPTDILQVILADDEGQEDRNQLPLVYPPGTTEETKSFAGVDMSYLEPCKQQQLMEVLEEFADVFSDDPGSTNVTEHHIKTDDSAPTNQHPYRTPVQWKEALDQEIQQLLQHDIVTPSTSPWTAPVVCVRKKDGNIRMCVDYRRLNAATQDDVYPLPRVEEMIEKVSGAAYISTLDLSKGYYQIPVAPEDQEKTAFATPTGKYEFCRMPFGLKGAPATFQRAMDNLLRPYTFADAYIDDIVDFSDDWEQHLAEVLHCLKAAGFTAKLVKCSFAKRRVDFLGHVVGGGTVKPQAGKIQAIQDFRRPKTKKDIRAFLGLAGYYRKFIPNFSHLTASLSDLNRKGIPNLIPWTDKHQEAFDKIKAQLSSESVLTCPNQDLPFILHTDASGRGIGSVLSQWNGQGEEKPVAYYSRKLEPRERKYTVTELECLAVVDSVRHFAVYLLGADFTIVTDHGALKHLSTIKHGGPRLTRWALALQPFSYKVEHRAGGYHGNADGLSRQAWDEEDHTPGSALLKGGTACKWLL